MKSYAIYDDDLERSIPIGYLFYRCYVAILLGQSLLLSNFNMGLTSQPASSLQPFAQPAAQFLW